MSFFIIPQEIYNSTDWQASPFCNVAPRLILSGPHAGSYAVNTAILKSDPCFEKFRTLLEALEITSLTYEEFNPKGESEDPNA